MGAPVSSQRNDADKRCRVHWFFPLRRVIRMCWQPLPELGDFCSSLPTRVLMWASLSSGNTEWKSSMWILICNWDLSSQWLKNREDSWLAAWIQLCFFYLDTEDSVCHIRLTKKGSELSRALKLLLGKEKICRCWLTYFDNCLPKPFITSASALERAQYLIFHFLSQIEN